MYDKFAANYSFVIGGGAGPNGFDHRRFSFCDCSQTIQLLIKSDFILRIYA